MSDFLVGRLSCRRRFPRGVICEIDALLLFAFALFLFSAPRALAHDPYESFTLATIRADDLELNVTMAQSTALKLIDPNARIAGLTTENFTTHREKLSAEARTMFVVTSLKSALPVRRIVVDLTEENDVSFRIYFPRPASGRLHFRAAFLKKLGDGYGGILDTTDTENRQLGWEKITPEIPDLEIIVPSPDPPRNK